MLTISILRTYTEGDMQITEYTKDGKTVSHVVKTLIPKEEPKELPTIEEQILAEVMYQTALLEISMIGGNEA